MSAVENARDEEREYTRDAIVHITVYPRESWHRVSFASPPFEGSSRVPSIRRLVRLFLFSGSASGACTSGSTSASSARAVVLRSYSCSKVPMTWSGGMVSAASDSPSGLTRPLTGLATGVTFAQISQSNTLHQVRTGWRIGFSRDRVHVRSNSCHVGRRLTRMEARSRGWVATPRARPPARARPRARAAPPST